MPLPQITHLTTIDQRDPILGRALKDVQSAIGSISDATVTSPSGQQINPPPPIVGMVVSGAGGVHHISIQDGAAAIKRGIEYHLEASPTPDFKNPVGISLGPHRSYRGSFGAGPTYFQAYSSYQGSAPNTPYRHPVAVDAGGVAGPDYHPQYTGSGTSSCSNAVAGQGAGVSTTRLGPAGRTPAL
jgi:hypothetical protein